MDKIFDLDYQWHQYCERARLPEEKMHPVQAVETKKAFMGACGQMLILLRDDVAKYDEKEAIAIFRKMLDQVESFWKSELLKEQNKSN